MAQKIQLSAPPPARLVPIEIPYSDLTFDRRIGGGGFSEVFIGLWQRTVVAIKKLKIDEPSSGLKEFNREVVLMSHLRHPHIVGFYKACFEPGKYCIVMEHCEKGSLYHWLQTDESKAWPHRKRIALEIALALMYLHSENVIHRDLKSLNVLLKENLSAKISDFGLSKSRMESSLASSGSGSVVGGTLRWNPPELLKGVVKEHSTKTDMYSFGMILWEIVSRKVPFANQPDAVVDFWISQGQKETIPEQTPAIMRALIERCWDKSEKRPTAEQAVQELEAEEKQPSPFPPLELPSTLATPKPKPLPVPLQATPPSSLTTLRPPLTKAQSRIDTPSPISISQDENVNQTDRAGYKLHFEKTATGGYVLKGSDIPQSNATLVAITAIFEKVKGINKEVSEILSKIDKFTITLTVVSDAKIQVKKHRIEFAGKSENQEYIVDIPLKTETANTLPASLFQKVCAQ